MREFYRFQVCWHPTTANATSTVTITGATTATTTDGETLTVEGTHREALALACSLAAIGQSTVQTIAPVYPTDNLSGTRRLLQTLHDKLKAPTAKPGDATAAVQELGVLGLSSNHFAQPAVLKVIADDQCSAIVAGVHDPDALTTNMVILGPEAHASLTGITPDSIALNIMRELSLPVAIAPLGYPGSPSGIRRVTCTFDDSPASHAALRTATTLAQVLDAEVRVATTTPPPLSDADTITRTVPVMDRVLNKGCGLVTKWSGADTISSPEPDWAMHNKESSAEARWLPEELVVFGHIPTGADSAAWAKACCAFGIPIVLVPEVALSAEN